MSEAKQPLPESQYIGDELELFRHAKNWKAYYGGMIDKHLKGRVLEVGAGLGATTESLCGEGVDEWVCLEPDPELLDQVKAKIDAGELPGCCRCVEDILANVPEEKDFDAIIYIDVIEHIERDDLELQVAAERLKPGGKLIILVPAHQMLYTPFDESIGHFRRYNKARVVEAIPKSLSKVHLRYLDSVGLGASLANRMLLQSAMPTLKQILFWDRCMVPFSRFFDPLLFYTVGKSVLAVWERPEESA